jgi:hypothetical protein
MYHGKRQNTETAITYISLFWRNVDRKNQEYHQRNVTESPYVIKDLCKYVEVFGYAGSPRTGGGVVQKEQFAPRCLVEK